MPMYDLKCECCDHAFEEFGWASERYLIRCPKCGADHCQTNYGSPRRKGGHYGNRRFAGSEAISRTEGFRPFEVKRARKNLKEFQHCIRDDGSVVFADRQEQRQFVRAQNAWFDRLQRAHHREAPGEDVSRDQLEAIWKG